MSETVLGRPLSEPMERDAVHVAVVAVSSDEALRPGQRVRLCLGVDQMDLKVEPWETKGCIGVIDPFLPPEDIPPGVVVWLCLFPSTVTGMRHHWKHPAFPSIESETEDDWIRDEKTVEACKAYLIEVAEECSLSYDELLAGIKQYLTTGNRVCSGYDTPNINSEQFWFNVQYVTGWTIPPNEIGEHPFVCRC